MTHDDPNDVIAEYEAGFVGASYDAQAEYDLNESITGRHGYPYANAAITAFNLYGSGIGKLCLPYLAAIEVYPDCLPGGAQKRGSCVAWCTRNAALVSYCAYVKYGNDAVTAPPISSAGIANGAFSTDAIYWWRGKDSDGWFCDAAANVAMTKAGLVIRKNYPDIGLDLTEYSPQMEGKWGRNQPPFNVADAIDNNLVKNVTKVQTYEEARDLIANGYSLSTCGSEAFTKRRSAPYGICERTGGTWYHAMAITGGDFRSETMDKEGPLFLVQNSWGNYLGSSNNTIYGTNYKLPASAFWARWDDLDNRRIIAIGPSEGWPAQNLPDYGLAGIV